jgi:hypothetical protein
MPRVLLVGYEPEAVDYSNPALPPGMNAEKIRAGLAVTLKHMAERGWEGAHCLIRPVRRPSRPWSATWLQQTMLCRGRCWRSPASAKSCVV